MGHKIFISYKYKDNHVYDKSSTFFNTYTYTVRNYVDELEKKFDSSDNIYKGESDGEDLSKLADSTIWEKLKDRIYDSTLTIVMLSKGMREIFKEEKYQWIPREISYSLSENSRKDKNGNPITSHTNALLAIIIPDETNSYSYFVTNKTCCNTNCLYYDRSNIFNIMSNNMFNQKILRHILVKMVHMYIPEILATCYVLSGMIF
jgi:hypothetical protein